MPLPIASRWFEHRAVGGGVTRLWEPHVAPLLRCNIWHVAGPTSICSSTRASAQHAADPPARVESL